VTKPRRLGRGLEALLGRADSAAVPPPPAQHEPADNVPSVPVELPPGELPEDSVHAAQWPDPADVQGSGAADVPLAEDVAAPPDVAEHQCLVLVNVYSIDANPYQPRKSYDDAQMESLRQSLAEHGMIQPIAVRREGQRFQLISGERRLRAAMKAGWTEVPAQIIEADDRRLAEMAIVENLQRKDLTPLEKAESFRSYLDRYTCTQDELAARLKIDRSTVSNLIRLLELPEPVQDAIQRGKITQGHARALLPLGEEREQIELCHRVQREGLSVRAIEQLVQETVAAADASTDAQPHRVVDRDGRSQRTPRPVSAHLEELQQQLRVALGTKVEIRTTPKGRGRIVIHFASHEEFERLRELLAYESSREAERQAS